MPKDLEGVGAVQVFLDRSRQYERSECWGFVAHRLANYSLSGFEINKEGLFPKSSVEPLCPVRRRAEASLHARCLASALAGVPRWGASQASTTELEEVARAPAKAGLRRPASGSRTGAGSATSKGDQYPVCVILAERILVMDKPPTHDGGTKESFEQDKQKFVPQGAQTEETEAERSARERALERDYAKAKVKWESLAKQKDWTQ